MFITKLTGLNNRFYKLQDTLKDVDDVDISLPGDDKVDDNTIKDDKTNDDETDDEDPLLKDNREDDDNDDTTTDDDEEEPEQDLVKHSFSEIKTKYPDLFKDFPGLKPAFFRGQEFEKRFGSLEEADETIDQAERFTDLRDLVLTGDASKILDVIEEASPKALKNFANSFLPDLFKSNKELYNTITEPVILGILNSAARHGKDNNNENLVKAAQVLHKALYGSFDIGEVKNSRNDLKIKDDDDEEIEDKNNFYQVKQQELQTQVFNSIDKDLRKAVEKGLDPTGILEKRPNLKKRMIKDIISEIDSSIIEDETHMRRMSLLWKREQKSGFSGKLKDSIVTAYLSRAIAIMPKIRQQVRADVLGTTKEVDGKTKERIDNRKEHINTNNQTKTKTGVITVKEAREKGLSDRDIFANPAYK